jgi:hypothetical protein
VSRSSIRRYASGKSSQRFNASTSFGYALAAWLDACKTLTNYGKRATFQVSGPGVVFTHKAIFQRLAVEKKVNDVQRHTVTLRFSPS